MRLLEKGVNYDISKEIKMLEKNDFVVDSKIWGKKSI